MVLRIQKERLAGKQISLEQYIAQYQVTPERLKLAKRELPELFGLQGDLSLSHVRMASRQADIEWWRRLRQS
jgi:hypothetical protein